eukprot:135017-Amphidinium_carterae.1
MRLCFNPNAGRSPFIASWEQGWLARALGHRPLERFELPCPALVSNSVVDVEHATSEVMGGSVPQPDRVEVISRWVVLLRSGRRTCWSRGA